MAHGEPPLADVTLVLPAAPEDQRFKAIGLVLLGLSAATLAWLAADAVHQWPLDADKLGDFVLLCALALNLGAFALLALSVGCGGTRPWRSAGSRRAWALKLVIANLAVPALVYGLLSDAESAPDLEESGWDLALSAFGVVLLLVAMGLFRRSRRHEAASAAQAMADDPRPPVLYLRSFQDDGSVLLDDSGFPGVQALTRATSPASSEEELAHILRRIGPVVAIGKPGEKLPELGAARLYVSHEEWQAVVGRLMRQAGLVVVRVGPSPGVLWEIGQALTQIPRERLALVMLGDEPLSAQVAARLAPALGGALPAALASPRRSGWVGKLLSNPKRRIGGVVCFTPDGKAHAVPVRMWPIGLNDLLVMLAWRPAAGPLRHAWRQVFVLLGLDWDAGPRRRQRLVAVGLALLFGCVGAHWFYLGQPKRGRRYAAMLLLGVPIVMGWVDAFRFVWVERAEFERRFLSVAG
ncbi:MAG: TM2 domain-containing protein [Burkholderiaceae bacterium]